MFSEILGTDVKLNTFRNGRSCLVIVYVKTFEYVIGQKLFAAGIKIIK